MAKNTIGRRDIIDLPEFGISNIKAKVDTGAYTSSIHSVDQKIVKGSPDKLVFTMLDTAGNVKTFETTDFSERFIKNSFGHIEKRFVIKTKLLIFERLLDTEFSLADRAGMKHPVLLGRKFLKGQYLVDVTKFNLSFKQKRLKERKGIV